MGGSELVDFSFLGSEIRKNVVGAVLHIQGVEVAVSAPVRCADVIIGGGNFDVRQSKASDGERALSLIGKHFYNRIVCREAWTTAVSSV